jgi:antitoxin YefM
MDAISYSDARANLARTMDRVCDDCAPIIVTRHAKPSVVMLSLEQYRSLAETAYLLGSPANARRLLEAVESLSR